MSIVKFFRMEKPMEKGRTGKAIFSGGKEKNYKKNRENTLEKKGNVR